LWAGEVTGERTTVPDLLPAPQQHRGGVSSERIA
jgi:hypothetical protein